MWLDSDDTGELLSSLSSETARAVLTELHDEPGTASEIASRVDTSLQNARHHLSNLEQAGVIRIADTRYSEKGREMSVYAPSEEPLVVFVGRKERKHTFLDSLRGLVSVIGALGLVSLLVQWLVTPTVNQNVSGQLPRVGDALGNSGATPLGAPRNDFLRWRTPCTPLHTSIATSTSTRYRVSDKQATDGGRWTVDGERAIEIEIESEVKMSNFRN
ncbi:ArsR/SmtB family transcription factor [Halocatena marina]|uniref:ArsR/SmtB family transcription factor n=1 Tax=Halocatena marina TaxID=2934937 RepID=UPI00360F7EE9